MYIYIWCTWFIIDKGVSSAFDVLAYTLLLLLYGCCCCCCCFHSTAMTIIRAFNSIAQLRTLPQWSLYYTHITYICIYLHIPDIYIYVCLNYIGRYTYNILLAVCWRQYNIISYISCTLRRSIRKTRRRCIYLYYNIMETTMTTTIGSSCRYTIVTGQHIYILLSWRDGFRTKITYIIYYDNINTIIVPIYNTCIINGRFIAINNHNVCT